MRKFVLPAAALVVLAVAGLASATPRLIVSGTTVQILEDKSDAAPLHISIYVPTGYTAALAQTPGSQIGTVHADLQALAISPDAIISADGAVLAAPDPNTAALTAAAQQCTQTSGPHAATWLLHVTISGTTLDVPIWVDPTTGASTALGVAVMQLCLPDPYDNAPAAARSAFGAKIINAQMKLNPGLLSGPGGLWRSLITPWNTASPAPDLAHTVEAQSIVSSDEAKITLKAKKAGKGKVTLSGTVTRGSDAASGATVTLTGGGKSYTLTTSATGTFSKTVALKKATKFRASAAIAQRDTACVSPLPASQVPGGCIGATIAGSSASSATVPAKP